jgi:Protein of unknown function (DUF1579)
VPNFDAKQSDLSVEVRFAAPAFALMRSEAFSGIGIDGYDNLRKKYVTAWMDTMGTGIFMMEGTASADGKTIILKGQHAEPGGRAHDASRRLEDRGPQYPDV